MALDDLLKHKTLFVFDIVEQPGSISRPLEFFELQHPNYRLKLHPDIYYEIINDDQKRMKVMENINGGLLRAIAECFTEKFSYYTDEEDNGIVAYIGELPNPIAVALAMYNEEGFTRISCASGVQEFLQNNSKAILANVEPLMERLGGNRSPLIVPVSRVSAYDLLRRVDNPTVPDPIEPRPSEFDSLEDYMSRGRNEIRIGDIIYGVTLTGRHKSSKNGTFTLSGGKSPIQVIVQNSSQGDISNVRFTEKINNGLYRATQYTRK
ncbi:MAG: hypothetical protein AABX74_04055 [Nanoarchaeota archaeon]